MTSVAPTVPEDDASLGVQLWPAPDGDSGACPECGKPGKRSLVFQGIHVASRLHCPACGSDILHDLPYGHARLAPFRYDLKRGTLSGGAPADIWSAGWYAHPFLQAMRAPRPDPVHVQVHRRHAAKDVVVLDCLDYLYGHALLKLLNADNLKSRLGDRALVVIVQPFLEWLVPEWVAEVWVAPVPLSAARDYWPSLDAQVQQEMRRFRSVRLAPAHSHPSVRDLQQFTAIAPRDPRQHRAPLQVTFIWREDRPWAPDVKGNPWARFGWSRAVGTSIQARRVTSLLRRLRAHWPNARFVVAGLGRRGRLPAWIRDERVSRFDEATERRLCQTYADSDLVIGVHGSSMLLPSGLAGLSLHLTPRERWGNLMQDALVLEPDRRIALMRHRYLPLSAPVAEVAAMAISQIDEHAGLDARLSGT